MKTKKSPLRTLSVLLTVAVLFGVFACLPVGAAEELTDGDFKYTVENGEATIVDYIGEGGDVTIPSTLGGSPVTAIGDWAFGTCHGLTSVVIPDSVTTIGDYAFYEIYGLTSIVIPDSVTEIGDWAFRYCSDLEHITVQKGNAYYEAVNDCLIEKATDTLIQGCNNSVIPNGVKAIEDFAFYRCDGLTNVAIPDSVTSIGEYAFSDCDNLTSVELLEGVTTIEYCAFYQSGITGISIPASVTSIGDRAFGFCSNLEHITVQAGNAHYEAVNDCLIEKSTKTLLRGCKNSVIPNGVKAIGECAFSECEGLTSIVIPGSVTEIGEHAFDVCLALNSVFIPDSVTKIGEDAFIGCSALKSIFIPSSVTSMGYYAFGFCDGLTVYCEADSQPEGWDEFWMDPYEVTVVWGCQPPETPASLGDPSGDGTVNANDYMMLKRYVLHTFSLTDEQLAVADINADGDVNANDYMILKRAVLGTYKLPSA